MNDQNLRNFSINFGPQHPAAHGVLRLVLELDGEVVERVDPHIGLLHRGTEKLMEARTYLQNVPYLDRLDYVAPMNQEHAYALAVERLLGVSVPRRAQLIRVLYCEIGRLLVAFAPDHHPGDGRRRADAAALGVRGTREADGLLRARQRLAHACCLFPAGGVHQDLPRKLVDDIEAFCDPFLKVCDDLEVLLTGNRILQAAQCRHRCRQAGGCLGVGFLGRHGARIRRSVGSAQGSAVRVLRGNGFRYSRRQKRRLL